MADKGKILLNVIIGILCILLSIMPIIYPEVVLVFYFFLLTLGLAAAGLAWIIMGFIDESLTTGLRILSFIAGFISAGIAVTLVLIELTNPGTSLDFLIIIFAAGLIIGGIENMVGSYISEEDSIPVRFLKMVFGIAVIALSISILLLPTFGLYLLIILLSIELLIIGITKIVKAAEE